MRDDYIRHRVEHRRREQSRHDRHHPDAVAREIAGDREREAEDTALREISEGKISYEISEA